MTKLRLIRQQYLDNFRDNISENIDMYKNSDSDRLPDKNETTFEIDVEADLDMLHNLIPSNAYKDEVENCLIVYNCLNNIKPDLARDERLWAYLTHYYAFDYTCKRWAINDDSPNLASHIKSHYFGRTNRALERDNSISRLWWTAHITNKATAGTLHDNLTSLLFRSDVRSSFIERPSTSRNVNLLSTLLDELRSAYSKYCETGDLGIFERKSFRKIMVQLNEVGGYKLLDALNPETLRNIITE